MMSQDKTPKPGDGLCSQLKAEDATFEAGKTKAEDIIKAFEKYAEIEEQRCVQNRKAGKEFERELKKRSKELGKPIPPVLYAFIIEVYQNGVFYTSSKVYNKYKEWLQ